MRQVYTPANAAEAHMLAHLLAQEDILAHVQGEQLQGASGELPVGNLVRLEVSDEDYDRARALLTKWEQAQTPPDPEAKPARKFPTVIALIFLVLGLGGGWVLKSVVDQNSMWTGDVREEDRNEDGKVDSRWFYRPGGGHAYRGEFDHNHDGRIDIRTTYDAGGTVTEQDEDWNFDGVLETKVIMRAGVVARAERDTDNNGVVDSTSYYEHGALVRDEIMDSRYGSIVRINYYENGRLVRAEIDLNRDGFRETRRTFDPFGEVVGTETLRR